VLFYVLFVLCRSVYCLCVNVYCTTATGWQPNCSWQIYHIISYQNIYFASQGEIFRTRPDRPWGPPSHLYKGHRFTFPVVKRPGRGVGQPPISSAEVKERVELYLYYLSGPVLRWTYLLIPAKFAGLLYICFPEYTLFVSAKMNFWPTVVHRQYGSLGGPNSFGPTVAQYFPLKLILQCIIIIIIIIIIIMRC